MMLQLMLRLKLRLMLRLMLRLKLQLWQQVRMLLCNAIKRHKYFRRPSSWLGLLLL